MTPKERFLAALTNQVPDRVPVTPDFSNFIPCKRTGLPFWEIYFKGTVPLWRAYLEASDYFGIEAWMASCTFTPYQYAPGQVEWVTQDVYRPEWDAMVREQTVRTPDGELTCQQTCFRGDPPSPSVKLIKDLETDFPRYRWLLREPVGIDETAVNAMRAECERRQQAFGLCIGYPGFQSWMNVIEDGVAQLSFAEMDHPALLEEWFERDLANGTRAMELLLAVKPDYILFGGSGTITLASPDLARKYAIPALKKWSAMARQAAIPTMLHSCGKSRVLVDMLCDETDVGSINPLEIAPMGDVDLAEVKQARGRQISLMGNLHTTEVMLRGTPALVRDKACEAMRAAGGGGGFILSTGDQCGRDTPDANLFALVETAHRFGRYDPATGTLPDLPVASAALTG